MLGSLLRAIWRFFTQPQTPSVHHGLSPLELEEAIEKVVEKTDPRFRALSNYEETLKEPVALSLKYSSELVAKIPGPLLVSSGNWSQDPQVNGFFSGVEDLRDTFNRNDEIQSFFRKYPNSEYPACYALLTMNRHENTVLGTELQGERLRRDVRQTTVSFSEKRIVDVATSEAALRTDLQERAFEALIGHALEHLVNLQRQQNSRTEEKHLRELQTRLQRSREAGLEVLIGNSDRRSETPAADRPETGKAPEKAIATLDEQLERIAEVLVAPQDHLKIHWVDLRLNRMNVKLEPSKDQAGNDLHLAEFSLGGDVRSTLTLVRFPREDVRAREDFLDLADRILQ